MQMEVFNFSELELCVLIALLWVVFSFYYYVL